MTLERKNYKILLDVISNIPKRHLITGYGDFNAHLGDEKSIRYTFHERTNNKNNAKSLLEQAKECDLHITKTLFKKSIGKQ